MKQIVSKKQLKKDMRLFGAGSVLFFLVGLIALIINETEIGIICMTGHLTYF